MTQPALLHQKACGIESYFELEEESRGYSMESETNEEMREGGEYVLGLEEICVLTNKRSLSRMEAKDLG